MPPQCPSINFIKAALFNIQSLNKSFLINDLITTNNLTNDFMLLSEIWLHISNSAPALIESTPPTCYCIVLPNSVLGCVLFPSALFSFCHNCYLSDF